MRYVLLAVALIVATIIGIRLGYRQIFLANQESVPVAWAAYDEAQRVDGLIAGTDYENGVLTLQFTLGSGVATVPQAEAAIADFATNDPVIAAATILSVESVFHTQIGAPNREEKIAQGLDRYFRIEVPTATDLIELLTAYQQQATIQSAELVFIEKELVKPNDPYFDNAGLYGQRQWNHFQMHSQEAWDITTGDAQNPVVIAIIDTGFDLTHPDLADRIWINQTESGSNSTNGIDDDHNGYIDDWRGWDFAGNDNDPTEMTFYHGSVVAGAAAAATNNQIGVASVCWSCSIMAIKNGGLENGIEYAVDNGAEIINISLGNARSQAIHDAIRMAVAKGIPVVAAAGNVGETGQPITYPAAYPEVIAVAANWENGERAGGNDPNVGSAWGTRATIAAPVETWSTKPYGLYEFSGGTSIAAPMVSGLIGLLKANRPELRGFPDTVDTIASALRGAVNPIYVPAGTTARYIGTGNIDALKTLQYLSIPVAVLDPSLDDVGLGPNSILEIRGTAAGTNFNDYTVEYAPGTYPAPGTWTTIAAETTPVTNGLLATFYDAPSLAEGVYTFRLTVHTQTIVHQGEPGQYTGTDTSFDLTQVVRGQRSTFSASDRMGYRPAVADLDSDGKLETIAVSADGLVHAWNEDGTAVTGWPQEMGGVARNSPAVADLDNDGKPEVVSASTDGKVYVWNHDGTPMNAAWPHTLSGDYINDGSSPVLADIDNDGQLEIILGLVYGPNYQFGGVGALETNGSWVAGDWAPHGFLGVTTLPPAVGDVDGDGQLEVVVATSQPALHIYQADGFESPAAISLSGDPRGLALADFDGDQDVEIVVSLSAATDSLRVYKGDGTRYPGFPTINSPASSGPSIGDVDNDGQLEIVVGTNNRQLHVYNLDGTEATGWPKTFPDPVVSHAPTLADVTNDGWTEIIFGTRNRNHTVFVVDHTGTAIPGWESGQPTEYHLFNTLTASPVVTDLNADGLAELVVASETKVYVWWLDANLNAQKQDWPMAGFHARTTSQYGQHCAIVQQFQCKSAKPFRCTTGIFQPKCQVCGCPSSAPYCLESGYCSKFSLE